MPSSVPTSRWNGARRSFPHALHRSCLPLHLTRGRLRNTIGGTLANWAFTQNQFNKWCRQNSRSLERYDRWLSITLQYRSAIPKDTNHDVAYSLTPFSRRQVAAQVLVFTSFAATISYLFCVISSSSSSSSSVPSSFKVAIIDRHKWVLVLSTRLPSLVSSTDSACSHARITPSSMLGMSRCNVVFVSQLGRSTSDHNKQHWVAELQSLHLNTFIHNFASCAPLLLDFGVDGVRTIFQIQTYRTRFCNNLVLNELLTLPRQGAVVRDNASLHPVEHTTATWPLL